MSLLRTALLASLLASPGAALAAPPRVQAEAAHLVLGDKAALPLTVTPSRPGAVLRAAANAGTLAELPAEKGGEVGGARRFVYRPPPGRAPRTALLAFWEEGEGAPELAVHRVPLHGRLSLKVATRPGAEVTVQVAGRDFGPVRASRAGGAAVDVEVPPDVTRAQVEARSAQQVKRTELPIDVPATSPLWVLMVPETLSGSRPSHLFVVHTGALNAPMLEFVSRGLRLQRVKVFRDRALFRVERVQDGRAPHLEVRVAGEAGAEAVLDPAEG
jgi:hypothetical protein